MALTPSTMLPLGTPAPAFRLIDPVTNQYVSLDEIKSPIATVIFFTCNHCPYVKHIQDKVVETAKKYQDKGVSFVAINSNDATNYPQDNPEAMKAEAATRHFTFPYLYDETQEIAKAYQAACTPDFYIFDRNLLCVYRGRFDGSTPGNNVPVTGSDLSSALDAVLQGNNVECKPTAQLWLQH